MFLLVVVVGLTLNVGVRPLTGEEPRRALVALEMDMRGNPAVPTTHGVPYYSKPPLFNWVLLGFMKLFGSSAPWVLRLPTVLSALLTALLVHRLARPYLGPEPALTAAALFLTFGNLLFKATLSAEIDVFYTLVVALQAAAIFFFEREDRLLPLFAISYLLAAVGFLTKGVPSIAVQVVTLVAWLARVGKLRALVSWRHAVGIAVFALCVGGYFAWYARHGDPIPYVAKLMLESTSRTAAGHGAAAVVLHAATFPFKLLWLVLPWSLFVPFLLRREFRAAVRDNPLLGFSAVFVAANLVPHWLSPGTRDRYMYVFLPFVAVLLAAALQRARQDAWYARATHVVLGACVAVAALAAVALPFTPLGAFVASPAAWALVCVALVGLAVAFARRPAARLTVALLTVACVRVAYDVVMPNLRSASAEARYYRSVVDVLNGKYAREQILLAAHVEESVWELPVAAASIAIREAEWFPTVVSYYFTVERHAVLELAPTLVPGKLHLAKWEFPVDRKHEVVEVFRSPPGLERDLKLVRVLE